MMQFRCDKPCIYSSTTTAKKKEIRQIIPNTLLTFRLLFTKNIVQIPIFTASTTTEILIRPTGTTITIFPIEIFHRTISANSSIAGLLFMQLSIFITAHTTATWRTTEIVMQPVGMLVRMGQTMFLFCMFVCITTDGQPLNTAGTVC